MAAQHDPAEHRQCEMDITEHQQTFAGFIKAVTWVSGIAILVLVFLALANA
jgi:hypothetical protein